jgi:hypothetical protein
MCLLPTQRNIETSHYSSTEVTQPTQILEQIEINSSPQDASCFIDSPFDEERHSAKPKTKLAGLVRKSVSALGFGVQACWYVLVVRSGVVLNCCTIVGGEKYRR